MIIQVIMVGLIIAFPALVSTGLTKETTIDADKALMQMQTEEQAKDAQEAASAPAAAASGEAPADTDAPTKESDNNDEAMKALMDSIKKDDAKKP